MTAVQALADIAQSLHALLALGAVGIIIYTCLALVKLIARLEP